MIASYKTNDYDRFVTLDGNRSVGRGHVNKIKAKIAKKNLLQYIPIVVNERMEVIDGQHRLQAARELEIPVYYVVAPGTNLVDVQDINTATKVWDLWAFLLSYVKQGNDEYIKLKAFCEEHGLSISVAIIVLNGLGRRTDSRQLFKEGKFKASFSAYSKGDKVVELMKLLNNYSKINLIDRDLANACRYLVYKQDIDLKRLRIKLEAMRNADPEFSVKKHANKDYYVVDVQHIYNYRTKTKVFHFV